MPIFKRLIELNVCLSNTGGVSSQLVIGVSGTTTCTNVALVVGTF